LGHPGKLLILLGLPCQLPFGHRSEAVTFTCAARQDQDR
jgi:hypothetical protein